jgi:hypothetical protein
VAPWLPSAPEGAGPAPEPGTTPPDYTDHACLGHAPRRSPQGPSLRPQARVCNLETGGPCARRSPAPSLGSLI